MRKLIIFIIILFTSVATLRAQTQDKSQMEKERADLQDEIKSIEKDYKLVKGKTKASLGELNVISRKINLQERYINNISKEIRLIDDDIYLSNLEIRRLKSQLDTLKAQYAKSVVYAYKNRSNYDYLNFIFSATTFNDALKRITYLKQYRNYREKQVETIKETQALISERQKQQIAKKENKNVALKNQSSQVAELSKQKDEKAKIVSQLKSQEKDLNKQLTSKRKRDNDLKRAITAAIQREIMEAKKEAARRAEAEKAKNTVNNPTVTPTAPTTTNTKPATTTPAKEKSYLTFNKEEADLAANFEQNKGKLPWPVDNGFVSVHFGVYTIPETKIKGDNPGITISTPSAGQSVKAVFNGEVVAVHNLGDVQAVIIRHGKYFTSYSNLSSASVSKGANVSKGQVIGRTASADDGSGGQLDFMLLIENREQNPEAWLRRGG